MYIGKYTVRPMDGTVWDYFAYHVDLSPRAPGCNRSSQMSRFFRSGFPPVVTAIGLGIDPKSYLEIFRWEKMVRKQTF